MPVHRGVDKIVKPKPPVKWAGGKSQLLSQLRPLYPDRFGLYVEPFVGGGAVFFDLQSPGRAVLIDGNSELMNFYRVLRENPEALLFDLARHQNTEEYYYQIRALDPEAMDGMSRASRFLYLNKTGYNGLWRINRQGKHNVPFGRYEKPQYRDETNLRKVSRALQNVELICADFSESLNYAVPKSFVYFDPPYHPLTSTANFTGYTSNCFGEEDQRRLAGVFCQLDAGGCYVMLSNSDTDFIRGLFAGFEIVVVKARRTINCRPDRRGPIAELVIRNYHQEP